GRVPLRWREGCSKLLRQLREHPSAWMLARGDTPAAQDPDAGATDLETVQRRLDSAAHAKPPDFAKDVRAARAKPPDFAKDIRAALNRAGEGGAEGDDGGGEDEAEAKQIAKDLLDEFETKYKALRGRWDALSSMDGDDFAGVDDEGPASDEEAAPQELPRRAVRRCEMPWLASCRAVLASVRGAP
ncbi:hypothetical protein T484DRAFT_1821509, partial [Baffinella frigidus]